MSRLIDVFMGSQSNPRQEEKQGCDIFQSLYVCPIVFVGFSLPCYRHFSKPLVLEVKYK